MGGKSTYMRQTALIALLAHIGSFVPANPPFSARSTRSSPASAPPTIWQGSFDLHGRDDRVGRHPAPRHRKQPGADGRGRAAAPRPSTAWRWLSPSAAICSRRTAALTLFATHYFELTLLANEYPDLANVHLDAIEHGERIVFLHAVEEGPANQSYGIQVAALAGIPTVRW
jgi:DNA mismatch repair protein MutS